MIAIKSGPRFEPFGTRSPVWVDNLSDKEPRCGWTDRRSPTLRHTLPVRLCVMGMGQGTNARLVPSHQTHFPKPLENSPKMSFLFCLGALQAATATPAPRLYYPENSL